MKTETPAVNNNNQQQDQGEEIRRGPWTLEEDNFLIHYVACHGEGRWNLLAKSAGLKRTGKSCRLRWLNYLKPDIKRGNLSPQEQLLILELHSKWGNRWSKIAAQLPGRTDNEIKNYWRTRVQKQARQLNMESNSQSFIEAIRCFYMPRLVQKIEQNSTDLTSPSTDQVSAASQMVSTTSILGDISFDSTKDTSSSNTSLSSIQEFHDQSTNSKASSSLLLDDTHCTNSSNYGMDLVPVSATNIPSSGYHVEEIDWLGNDIAGDSIWDLEELLQFRQ